MITRLITSISSLLMAATLLGESMTEQLRSLIPEQEIQQKVKEYATKIEADYRGKDLVIVMVMKGALCLVADLIRQIDLPLHLEVVQCSSYGARGDQRGELQVVGADRLKIHHRDVLIVDDVFDSGQTLATLYESLKELQPHSIKSLVLLSKNVPHVTDLRPDYVLFDIDNFFVVGYGLDYKERYRGLNGIYIIDPR